MNQPVCLCVYSKSAARAPPPGHIPSSFLLPIDMRDKKKRARTYCLNRPVDGDRKRFGLSTPSSAYLDSSTLSL